MKKVLLINICKEKLAYFEFVKPIEDILKKNKIKYVVKDYKEVSGKDLDGKSNVIICGTTIFDNEFLEEVSRFNWLLDFPGKVLGICGGMHVIGLIFGGKLDKKTEVGYYDEKFEEEFLGLTDNCEVYHLHNNYIDFNTLKEFMVFVDNKVSQAVRHKKREIYGVLFHPEVRQKELIRVFCSL